MGNIMAKAAASSQTKGNKGGNKMQPPSKAKSGKDRAANPHEIHHHRRGGGGQEPAKPAMPAMLHRTRWRRHERYMTARWITTKTIKLLLLLLHHQQHNVALPSVR